MKPINTTKVLIASAAMAGLISGSTLRTQASTINLSPTTVKAFTGQLADGSTTDKHGCKGQNSCKGTGGCKTSDNGCKGKNSCKGKGGCATDGSKG